MSANNKYSQPQLVTAKGWSQNARPFYTKVVYRKAKRHLQIFFENAEKVGSSFHNLTRLNRAHDLSPSNFFQINPELYIWTKVLPFSRSIFTVQTFLVLGTSKRISVMRFTKVETLHYHSLRFKIYF